jgi:hypothetical protein
MRSVALRRKIASIDEGSEQVGILTRFGRYVRSNALASVALFVALSGTALAATELPRNSVGTEQLKAGAVHTSDIHGDAVAAGDINGFSWGATHSVLSRTTIAQGAEPHLFAGPRISSRHLAINGAVQLTNPQAAGSPPRDTARVTVAVLVNGALKHRYVVTIPDGATQSLPYGFTNRAAVSGFQEVDSRVGSVGADVNVDGGYIQVDSPVK